MKKAIIVGASSGIGLATAELLMKNGYHVTNISRSYPEAGAIDTVLCDVAEEGALASAIAEAAGGEAIDALVYSAGCSMAAPIEYARSDDYRYLFEVNFFGALEGIRAVIPLMKNGGRIVLISSLAATFPIAFDAFYSASKAALDMLAAAADVELRPLNIRVTSVRPGGVRTDFTFKRKVYSTGAAGEYAQKQNSAVTVLADIEQDGISPDAVALKIFSVLESANPPTKVAVGLRGKMLDVGARVLPIRVVDYLNSSRYGQE